MNALGFMYGNSFFMHGNLLFIKGNLNVIHGNPNFIENSTITPSVHKSIPMKGHQVTTVKSQKIEDRSIVESFSLL
jgi:hypothetical protein